VFYHVFKLEILDDLLRGKVACCEFSDKIFVFVSVGLEPLGICHKGIIAKKNGEIMIIWHNPKCSKSREALKLLEEKGTSTEVFKYLDTPPSHEEIVDLLQKLGISARELMRTKEDLYKELGLAKVTDEVKLIEALAEHPKLIERPILIDGNRAVIGRPVEKVIEFLG
jgi:arsenate reductase